MQVVVKFGGRVYKGRDARAVVKLLMSESHDETDDPVVYKRRVALRARVEFGEDAGKVRTAKDWDFLVDLEALGQFKVLKKILAP